MPDTCIKHSRAKNKNKKNEKSKKESKRERVVNKNQAGNCRSCWQVCE